MKKARLIFLLLALSLFVSCTPTLEFPNVLRGIWGLRIDGADKELYTLNEDYTYSHIVTQEGNTTVTYKGTYHFTYNRFNITSAKGLITFTGKNEVDSLETESNSFNFEWLATADQGPISITLSQKDNKGYLIKTEFVYYGSSN